MSTGRYFAAELGGEVQIYRRGARGRVSPVAVVPSESAGNRLAAELNRGERFRDLAEALKFDATDWAAHAGVYCGTLRGLVETLHHVTLPGKAARALHVADEVLAAPIKAQRRSLPAFAAGQAQARAKK